MTLFSPGFKAMLWKILFEERYEVKRIGDLSIRLQSEISHFEAMILAGWASPSPPAVGSN